MYQRLFSASIARLAGTVATLTFLLFIVVQFLLALGVLPISIAWGGTQTTLTPSLRLASVAAALILAGCVLVIRRRAGFGATTPPSRAIRILAWVITLSMGLMTLGNLASSSSVERMLFAPLSLVLALSCLLVSAASVGEQRVSTLGPR
jgi:hypothetical protein